MSLSLNTVMPGRLILIALFFGALVLAAGTPVDATDENPLLQAGETLYQSQCISCHGEQGRGTEDYYPSALIGDASVGELASIISDTMPEDDPDACVAEDAVAVATYIHHAFYSEAAQIRNRPPRQALQRLTGAQLRQSLTDLYASAAGAPNTTWEHVQSHNGLSASYYDGKGWKKEDRKIERVDPTVDFDFGLDGPGEGINGKQFHAHWSGGLKVEETGRYELIVRSTTSFVLHFGDDNHKLIDNHVQSEGRTEFRRSLMLTAGRFYRLKLDLNQRERKTDTPPSRVSLSWIPPGGTEQVIPTESLVPGWIPPALILSTVLPPDDSSYGFQRGISVDTTWDESVTATAIEFADQVRDNLWPRYVREKRNDEGDRKDKLRTFLSNLVAVAHRGSVEETKAGEIVDMAMSSSEDENEQIKLAMLLAIKSPRFLYPTLDADRSPSRRAANRLALTLYDSLPIRHELVQAAEKGELADEQAIRRMAFKLVDDARTRAKMRDLLHHWLEVSSGDDLQKNKERFAGFDQDVISDLRESLDRFLDDVVWGETSDYRQLVSADWAYTTDRLAAFYGEGWQPAEADDDARLRRSQADADKHVGVLTHPLVMAKLSYFDTTSPIHRGVFLIRHVMGRTLRPPNEAFTPLSPDLHPDLTTRERVALQTSSEGCQICHSKINPLGFALEQFDAAGRFRLTERDQPVDVSGRYVNRNDEVVEFNGARDLGNFIAGSRDAHEAFVSRVFQYFTKQPVAAYGPDRLQQLTEQFRQSGFNIRDLIVEVAVIAAQDSLQDQSVGT